MMQTISSGKSKFLSLVPVRRRRYLLYVLLAGFDVFAVSVSLYLNHRMMSIYIGAVQENHGWAEILRDTSRLGQQAAAINAPGNNVFETRHVDAEVGSMRLALARFGEHLGTLKERIATEATPSWKEILHNDLDAVRGATLDMAAEAELLFSAFKAEQMSEAGNRMARMDRFYDDANRALFQLREDIDVIQKDLFNDQTASAASLQKFEYVIAGFILLMVGGATYYGFQVAKQEEAEIQEHERTTKRKQAMDLRTRVLKQVMAAQEEERRRISRDLHDEIGQCLTSLLIGLRTLQSAASVPEAQAHAEELRRIASLALDEVRRMARGLRPTVLDDVGLSAALERFAEDFSQAQGVATDVKISGLQECRLPEVVETALYRITQEALNNVAKHADAAAVTIEVKRNAGLVQLQITDDGRGFDCREALADRGLGLSGMRERAALLDGAITIESKPGAGTGITVRIPLEGVTHGEDTRAHRG